MVYKSLKTIAIIESILFVGLGFLFLFFARKIANDLGVHFTSSNGLTDYKAIYGGLHIGLGFFMVLQLLRRNYHIIILIMFTATSGLAFARLLSIIIDQAITAIMLVLLGIEILGMALNGILLLIEPAPPERAFNPYHI